MKQPRLRDDQIACERAYPDVADPRTFTLNRLFAHAHGLSSGWLTNLSIEHDIVIERLRNGAKIE